METQLSQRGRTLVYSTVGDHDIKLDYYVPPVTGNLRALIYYHGGGMTAGSRRGAPFPQWLYDHCQERGYIFISADYRLCHPSTALDQVDDTKALLIFISSEEFNNELPDSLTLDATRIAVSGFSAGAYSARAACIYAKPKPAVMLSIYGLGGNLLLDHWTRARPPTSIAKCIDLNAVPRLLEDKTVVSDDSLQLGLYGIFGRQSLGSTLDKVDYVQRALMFPSDLKPGLLQSFVTSEYSPSIFVHGTADEVVSPQESIDQHEQLKKLGVQSELLLVKNGPHGLGDFSGDPESEVSKASMEAYKKALDFIDGVFSGVRRSGSSSL